VISYLSGDDARMCCSHHRSDKNRERIHSHQQQFETNTSKAYITSLSHTNELPHTCTKLLAALLGDLYEPYRELLLEAVLAQQVLELRLRPLDAVQHGPVSAWRAVHFSAPS
jgi:hypothetical protein